MTDQAFVTLTTNDSYAKGALVLGSSLKQHRTTRKLAVLTTPQVSDSMRKVLETVFDEVIMVDVLDSGDSAHLTLMKRPELGVTLTKLHCWSLTQYSKCVFMDADTLVLANIDDLFEREELSAAPDPGWPDCFNSGVFVYQPSVATYNQLLHMASEQGSFDGGDQGLLNMFFSSWATTDIRKHLPFIYNLSSISIYSYLPAFKAFGANAKVVHFLGQIKPWNYTYDAKTKSVKSESHDPTMTHPEFLSLWWDIFTTSVLPLLQQFGLVKDTQSYLNVEDVSGAISHLSLGEIPATAQPFVSSEERKERYIENPHTIFREILINLIFCVMLALQGKELPYCSLMLLAQPQVVIHFHPCRKVCWSFSSALPHLLPKRKWTGKILAIQPTVSLEQETGHRKGRT